MKRIFLKALTVSLLLASLVFVFVANPLTTPKAFASASLSVDSFDGSGTLGIVDGSYACDSSSGAANIVVTIQDFADHRVSGPTSVSATCDGALHDYNIIIRNFLILPGEIATVNLVDANNNIIATGSTQLAQ